MAQKKVNIKFEDTLPGSINCWTDLKEAEILSIEGVTSVGGLYLDGKRTIFFDSRYDEEEIKAELTELANAQENP